METITLKDLKSGVDPGMIADFFEFLFRNCNGGFFPVAKYTAPTECETFWCDVSNGFRDLTESICADENRIHHSWQFWKVLFAAPIGKLERLSAQKVGILSYSATQLERIIGLPCLWIDVDEILPDLEERLTKFRITPSIRLKTSPRGFHFYWILKNPATVCDFNTVCNAQVKLVRLLGGDLERCHFGGSSRIPGLLNFGYRPPHFIDYEVTDLEYRLEDFDRLPYVYWVDFVKRFFSLTNK